MTPPDLADVRVMPLARRALEIMIAGGHNLLLYGPVESGKTMLARRVAGLLPDLDPDEALEVTEVYRGAGRDHVGDFHRRAAVRMPHHTVSVTGLLGGGNPPRPGEVSLAHQGVLFLDDLPKFSRACLAGLREPLDEGEASIVRARSVVRYPARIQVLAAMNACPCGWLGHPERVCTDNPGAVRRYQERVSMLLEYMDLAVELRPYTGDDMSEGSAAVRDRIGAARSRQHERFLDTPWSRNADVSSENGALEARCPLSPEAARLLAELAGSQARGMSRLHRVARTIDDLDPHADPSAPISAAAVAEAARLRLLPEANLLEVDR